MLSQKDIDFIRKNQGSFNPSKTTVSQKKKLKPSPFADLDVDATPNQLIEAAGKSSSLAADAGGFIAGVATENPVVGAAVREALNNFSIQEYEGEDEFMARHGYGGGGVLQGVWQPIKLLFTGRDPFVDNEYSKLLYNFRRANFTDERMAKILGRAETPEEKMRRTKVLRLKGSGDYSLTSNSLINGGGVAQDAQIMPAGPRSTRILYREYLGDVFTHPTTPGAFFVASYDVNPGLLSTFPWLAPIAQQYEQWTPNGVVFEFRSTSSEYVATQALGSVIMAAEYDQLDTVYANKQEMLNSAYANECKPSCNILHGIECAKEDRPIQVLFVRSAQVPVGGDIRDYDCARFSIATQGGATANLNLGSLYVHYDITFRKEQLFNGVAAKGLLFDMIYGNSGVSGVTSAAPLPTLASGNIRAPGSVPIMTIGGLGTTIIFPSWIQNGRYLINYILQATVNTAAGTVAATTNCAIPVLQNALTNIYPNPNTLQEGGNVGFRFNVVVDITGPNAVLTFSGFTVTAPKFNCWLSCTQIGLWPGF